jgi:hypothetical protein
MVDGWWYIDKRWLSCPSKNFISQLFAFNQKNRRIVPGMPQKVYVHRSLDVINVWRVPW